MLLYGQFAFTFLAVLDGRVKYHPTCKNLFSKTFEAQLANPGKSGTCLCVYACALWMLQKCDRSDSFICNTLLLIVCTVGVVSVCVSDSL